MHAECAPDFGIVIGPGPVRRLLGCDWPQSDHPGEDVLRCGWHGDDRLFWCIVAEVVVHSCESGSLICYWPLGNSTTSLLRGIWVPESCKGLLWGAAAWDLGLTRNVASFDLSRPSSRKSAFAVGDTCLQLSRPQLCCHGHQRCAYAIHAAPISLPQSCQLLPPAVGRNCNDGSCDSVAQSTFATLEHLFEVFCRSLLLLYLLATLHLFARAAPLKRDCHRANGVIKGCRGFARGAPIALALCAALHCLPQAQAMNMPPPADETGLNGAADFPTDTAQRQTGPATGDATMPSDITASREALWGLGFRVPSVVVRFQRSHIANLQWWDRGVDAKSWCTMVKSDCFAADADVCMFPASPQPCTDLAILGEVPSWILDTMVVPVFIAVCGSHEPCFLELFQGRVSHSDIRLSTGHLWPSGGEIFVGFNLTPLPEDAMFTPSRGLLIRVCRPSRARVRLRSLDTKLIEASGLRRLGPDEAPAPIGARPGIAVLKPGDDQLFLDTPAGTTAAGIRALVTEAYSLAPGNFTVHVPCQPIRDLVVKGCARGSAAEPICL